MNKLALYHGEPYQRKKAVTEKLSRWREQFGDPELYRFDADRLDAQKLEQLLGGASLFAKTKIIHLREAGEVGEAKKIAEIVEGHSLSSEAVLFESESIEKSSPIYKLVAENGEMEGFSHPTGRTFPRFVNRILSEHSLELTPEAKKWFIHVMKRDLLRIQREVEKLEAYEADGRVGLDVLKELVWAEGRDKLFDFIDAFFEKRTKNVIELLEEMLNEGEQESKLFFMLAAETRKLVKVQTLADDGCADAEISSRTGMYKWLVGKKRDQLDNTCLSQLCELLETLHELDFKVKQGKLDWEEALFFLVYEFTVDSY